MEAKNCLIGGEPIAVHFGPVGGSGFMRRVLAAGIGATHTLSQYCHRETYPRDNVEPFPNGHDCRPDRAVITYPYLEGEELPQGCTIRGTTFNIGDTIRLQYPDSKSRTPTWRIGEVLSIDEDRWTMNTSRGPRTLIAAKVMGDVTIVKE